MGELSEVKKRMDKIESKIDVLSTQITKTDTQYDFIIQTIEKLENQLDKVLTVPSKRWETVTAVIITSVISLIIQRLYTP